MSKLSQSEQLRFYFIDAKHFFAYNSLMPKKRTKKQQRGEQLIALLVVLFVLAIVVTILYARNHPERFVQYTMVQETTNPSALPQARFANDFTDLPLYADGTLQLHMLDVGHGDALLLISPQGATMLVDAGDTGSEVIILPYLEKLGVSRLDIVVQSHKHADHIGGMQQVLDSGNLEVGCYLRPAANAGSDSKLYQRLLEYIAQKGWADYQIYQGNDTILDAWDSAVDFTVFSPLANIEYKNPNDTSIVMKLELGTTSLLLTGDAERPAENAILASLSDPAQLEADVLKLAHHSSDSSTTKTFLQAVNPSYVLGSCSSKYNNPDPVIMQRLRDFGILDSHIYITLYHGSVVTRLDGTDITFETEKEYVP